MSTAGTEPERTTAGDAAPAPPRDLRPQVPIVVFRSEDPQLQVYYSAPDAATAAQAAPQDAFYDVRGIALTIVADELEELRLEATGKADPDELQRRLIVELRRAAKLAAPGRAVPAEVKATLAWLAASPDPEFTVNALGLAEVDPGTARGGPNDAHSLRCRKCNWIQRWHGSSPPCCPG